MAYLTFSPLGYVGRLGNQLWQIAATIGLARKHGMRPRFPANWVYRPFFSLPDEMFDGSIGPEAWQLADLDHIDQRTRIYMQDLQFVLYAEEEIRECFKPSLSAKVEVTQALSFDSRPTHVIHVRRGDNVYDPGVSDKHEYYPIPSVGYYLRSAQEHSESAIWLYGDDNEWNDTVLKPQVETVSSFDVHSVRGIPRPKEHETEYATAPVLDWIDLLAMTYGNSFCLSNSTMGWWSAWLSCSEDVIYPTPWYGPKLAWVDSALMMPKKWREVDSRC